MAARSWSFALVAAVALAALMGFLHVNARLHISALEMRLSALEVAAARTSPADTADIERRLRAVEAAVAPDIARDGEMIVFCMLVMQTHACARPGTVKPSSYNFRTPQRNGKPMALAARVAYVERKINGALTWVRRPHSKEVAPYSPVTHSFLACIGKFGTNATTSARTTRRR